MQFLRSANLTIKLPLIITILVVVAILITVVIAYQSASARVVAGAESRLGTVALMRAEAVEDYFGAIQRDLDVVASNPRTSEAIIQFSTHFNRYANPMRELQRTYITDNPNPVGELDLMTSAGNGDPYDLVHERHHPYFDHVQNVQDYYDVFLFDTEGNLIYSVFKELDYATNMISGAWRDTGLAEVFRRGLEVEEGGPPAFVDFAPYAPSADTPASFMARSVFDASGLRVGVLAYQMPIDAINAMVGNPSGLGQSGDTFLLGRDGYMRTDSSHTAGNDILSVRVENELIDRAFSGAPAIGVGTNLSNLDSLFAVTSMDILGVTWALVAVENLQEIQAPLRDMAMAFLIATALLCLGAMVISVHVARRIIVPLAHARDNMVKISEKAFDIPISNLERADEIGEIARTLETFRASLQAADAAEQNVARDRQAAEDRQHLIVHSLQVALAQLSKGNLAAKIDVEFELGYDQIREDFNAATDVLDVAMRGIVTQAGAIQSNASEIASAADDLSGRTESQAAALEETAAALEELTASVDSAATGAQEVAVIVGNAQIGAEKGEKVVEQAVVSMGEIEASSKEISKIISLIEEIAFQTNLLALNAGVEAARAGDAGRGFAVVASEVRALALRSSVAASEIKTLIGSSSEQVQQGVERVNEAGASLKAILASVVTIADQVRTMAASTVEQSLGLNEINSSLNHLDEVTQKNAAMVEETTAASHALGEEANVLKNTTSQFQLREPTLLLASNTTRLVA